MSATDSQWKSKSRAKGLAASLVLHLLVLAALVAGISRPLIPAEAPPMQVELYTPSLQLKLPVPRPRAKAEAKPVERREADPALPAPIPEALRRQGPTNRPQPAGPTATRPMAEVTPFYRNHIDGCGKEDLNLMEPAEREKCQVRITAKAIEDEKQMKAEDRNARPLLRLDNDKRNLFAKEARRKRGGDAVDPMKPCEGSTIGLGTACLNHDKKE